MMRGTDGIEAPDSVNDRWSRRAVVGLFFLSGACGLVYEIIAMRLFRHVMGNTTFAISAVLTVFMGGLALGSFLGGRIAERCRNMLLLFAAMEASIGLYFLLLPQLVVAGTPLYAWLYGSSGGSFWLLNLTRFAFCGLLLLLPTTLMGATLPVLSRYFVRSEAHVGVRVGMLYAVNTFGAVLGIAAAGFLLIPSFGVRRTMLVACGSSLAVALLAFALSRSVGSFRNRSNRRIGGVDVAPSNHESKSARTHEGSAGQSVVLVAYMASGMAALIYEVAWSRILAMMLGSSVYAFSLMLSAFILGLALGSAAIARFIDRVREPLLWLAIVEVLVGVSALAVVPVLGALPLWLTRMIFENRESFLRLQLAEFSVILLIMLVPTTLMGAAFPLATKIVFARSRAVAATVGTVYTFNTVGAILGSAAAGFLLIPTLGTQVTILVAVVMNVVTGCVLLGLARAASIRGRLVGGAIVAAVTIVVVLAMPRWDPLRMSMGPFLTPTRYGREHLGSRRGLENLLEEQGKVLFYEEGIGATVTVRQSKSGHLVLLVNGKPDATTGGDMPTQLLSAHAPMMLHPDPKRVLAIGLASGITAGSIACYPVESIDCVEISPAMTRAARYFDEHNHRVLDDPRVTMVVADGRNHVALTDTKYDVITSEPSNPWMAGVADLFTKEFYVHCRDRLNDGGIMCSFLESYSVDGSSFRSILRTFQDVFPHVIVWQTQQPDFLMIGSKDPIRIDADLVRARLVDPRISGDLSRIDVKQVEDLFGFVFLDGQAVSAFTAGAKIHTDESASVEYRTPRTFYTNKTLFLPTAVALSSHLPCDVTPLAVGADPDQRRRIVDFVRARGFANRGYVAEWGSDLSAALQEYRSAAKLNRNDRILQGRIDFYLGLAVRLIQEGKMSRARELLERLLKIDPDHPKLLVSLGMFSMSDRDVSMAAARFRRALKTDPQNADALAHLASIAAVAGDAGRAGQLYRRLLRSHPDHVAALNGLAHSLLRDRRAAGAQEAVTLALLACRVTRNDDPRSLDTLAAAYGAAGQLDEARTAARRALQLAKASGDQVLSQQIEKRLKGLSVSR